MMTNNGLVDGSWELTITITDLQVEKTLRVRGDLHVGGVMLKLVEALDIAVDWSDHGLWWPEKNLWLSRTRSTLDQYGVQADAKLWFTPMHKSLRVLLPDLQIIDMLVNFSANVFTDVIKICKELGIRHPEELSLARKIDYEALKRNQGVSATRRTQIPGMTSSPNGHTPLNNSYDSGTLGSPYRNSSTPQGTMLRGSTGRVAPGSPFGTVSHSPNYSFNANGTLSPGSAHSLSFDGATDSSGMANSPFVASRDAWNYLHRPKNVAEKARLNAAWLDSSRSLMEQGIVENEIVLLRFKFFNFYDLNPKYDRVRINQIYEQAKWSLISEEIDCTEEQMMMFAALQLQVQQQSQVPQPDIDGTGNQSEDEIDAALTDLQFSLEGSSVSAAGDITRTPELHGYLRFFKPKKFAFKSFKRFYFVFRDTQLSMFRSYDEKDSGTPLIKHNLKGCEVKCDVNVSSQKFNIKLFVPTTDGMAEMWLRVESEEQYARWMAAFRLASKGRTMADSSYDSEVKSIQAFLTMQHPAATPVLSPGDANFQSENYVAQRFLRKIKTGKSVSQRILEAHANVQEMSLMDAKMNYIRAWQTLPEYGLTYFIVRLKGTKKEDLLAVALNRMVRMDLHSGDVLRTWRYQNVKAWSVNWEIKQVQVSFEGEEDIYFQCLTADCKVVHEFIGGYIFLSMRSGDRNQSLNEELFHKLTGGWH
jgi:kindlin 2